MSTARLTSIVALSTVLALPVQALAANVKAARVIATTINTTTGVGEVRIFQLGGILEKKLTDSRWSQGVHACLSAHGELAVLGNVLTQHLFIYDRNDVLRNAFLIDVSGTPVPPNSPGIRSIAYGPYGTIFAVGGWSSATINYLFEIDPETEETLNAWNLDVIAGRPFEPSRMILARDPVTGGDSLYVTEWSSRGLGLAEILVIDPKTLGVTQTITTPVAGPDPLGAVAVTPGGSILVGDFNGGTLWISDKTRTTWSQLQSCPGAPGAFSILAIAYSFAWVDAGACGASPGDIWQVEIATGKVRATKINLGSGSGALDVLVRH